MNGSTAASESSKDATPSLPLGNTVISHVEERRPEGWTNPDGSRLTWHTLLSADRDPTVTMSAGLTIISVSPMGITRHRHALDEIYFIVAGAGEIEVDGVTSPIRAGSCIFVPGNSWHSVRNPGPEPIELFYVFPTASFTDVVYEYESGNDTPTWDHMTTSTA